MTASVSPRSSREARRERLIAAGRVVLAAGWILAVWLDPAEPARFAGATDGLMSAYLLFSAGLAALVFGAHPPGRGLELVTHALDVAIFCVFVSLTETASSPYFVSVVFAVVAATFRWHLRGALLTGAAAIAGCTALGVYAIRVLHDAAFEPNRLLVRGVCLGILTILVGSLGVLEERPRRELPRLASWPRTAIDRRTLLADALHNAAEICGAPRAIVVWEEEEEPWVNVVAWSGSGLETAREPPGTYEPLVAEPLARSDFFRTAAAEGPVALVAENGSLRRRSGEPCHPALVARFSMSSVLSFAVQGEEFAGRLFLLDKERLTSDDLDLGRIAAETVEARLDQMMASRILRQAAENEARIRLARDLHDGLLQSLTGASLQLRSLQGLALRDPAALPARLAEVERIVVAEQRELRLFIEELRPGSGSSAERERDVQTRIRELCDRVAEQWGVSLELTRSGERELPPQTAREVYRMLQEALFNAVRHSGARVLRVSVDVRERDVQIDVADDGHGFPFEGRYDLEELETRQIGPVSLKSRIAAAGGRLVVESRPDGAHLEITVPIAEGEGAHAD
ncbi:MAG TPA: histidine kinase [Thermoanaerobaculia bacterium]|nr:histidine kinase [Thermoanaerobaculia bacterium]